MSRRRFQLDDSDDDYWNQTSSTNRPANSFDFFTDDEPRTSSETQQQTVDVLAGISHSPHAAGVGSDGSSVKSNELVETVDWSVETVDWSGRPIRPHQTPVPPPAAPPRTATAKRYSATTLGPTELLSTAANVSNFGFAFTPPTNKRNNNNTLIQRSVDAQSDGSVSSFNLDTTVDTSKSPRGADYTRLENEYRKLKLKFAQLRHERYKTPDVKDTIRRLLKGDTVVLELYKSKEDKTKLLNCALECGDGDVILAVVLFLRRSLSDSLFRELLLKYTVAADHYVASLRDRGKLQELATLLFSLGRTSDAAMVEFQIAVKKQTAPTKIQALKQAYNSGFSAKTLANDAEFVREYVALLERQQPIDQSDNATQREGREQKFKVIPKSFSLIDQAVLTTLYYCCLYHYELPTESLASPLAIKQFHKLSDKQFAWVATKALSRQRRWADIDQLLSTRRLLSLAGARVVSSPIPYERLLEILAKHNAPVETLSKYLRAVPDGEMKLRLAKEYACHEVAIDCLVEAKDRQELLNYKATKLTDHTKEFYHAEAALSKAANTWKN